ncbi:hypothetical protein EV102420_24_00120 [Pseudescherichia vulneris NBRC 102420]|uniref:Uncharacterized protein n=1 Tax=Pseudescherichia vulneris NBRC 102420 TaxID=1115515 RepID=A0A090V502_PSEVU|nr:hypothetical protein EV102420_24_00120 [Pseudescherichia vulneris NBRC 102420]
MQMRIIFKYDPHQDIRDASNRGGGKESTQGCRHEQPVIIKVGDSKQYNLADAKAPAP